MIEDLVLNKQANFYNKSFLKKNKEYINFENINSKKSAFLNQDSSPNTKQNKSFFGKSNLMKEVYHVRKNKFKGKSYLKAVKAKKYGNSLMTKISSIDGKRTNSSKFSSSCNRFLLAGLNKDQNKMLKFGRSKSNPSIHKRKCRKIFLIFR